MTLTTNQESPTKTTFYINDSNKKRMGQFVASRKKTEFINKALAEKLEELEDAQKRKNLIKAINNIVPIESNEPVVETIRKMRSEREKQLLENFTDNN